MFIIVFIILAFNDKCYLLAPSWGMSKRSTARRGKSKDARRAGKGSKLAHICQSVHHYIYDDVGERAGVKFVHYVLAMGDDGCQTDIETVCYLLIDATLAQK